MNQGDEGRPRLRFMLGSSLALTLDLCWLHGSSPARFLLGDD